MLRLLVILVIVNGVEEAYSIVYSGHSGQLEPGLHGTLYFEKMKFVF